MSTVSPFDPILASKPREDHQNEVRTLSRLQRERSEITIFTVVDDEAAGINGIVEWFDINNIAVRTRHSGVQVFRKENIERWTYN